MQKGLSSLYKSYKQKWFYNLVSTKFGVPKMIYLCNNASCINIRIHSHCVKSVQMRKYGVFSGPYFPVFGLNTEEKGKYLQYFDDFIATSSSCKFFTLVTSFYKTRYIGSLFIMHFLSFRKTFG